MSDEKAPDAVPEKPAAAERKAPRGATYRALRGFSYARPGGAVEVTYKTDHGDKKALSRDIHVEPGATGLTLPEAVVAAFEGQGVIEKE